MAKIVIAGAGPAALLMANYLARKLRGVDNEILLLEQRPDPRSLPPAELRTYPIAVQDRGREAITSVDPQLWEALERIATPTDGMCLHSSKKPWVISTTKNLGINRNVIVKTMLEELEKDKASFEGKCDIQFGCSIEDVDMEKKQVTILKENNGKTETISFDFLIAADGARSKVRQRLSELGKVKYSEVETRENYRTIHLSRTSPDGDVLLPNKMHGVMKGEIQVITVPVHPEHSSGAFIFPRESDPLKGMKTGAEVQAHFQEFSPHFLGKFVDDDEAEALVKRPVSSLCSVKCDRLSVDKCVLLIGDAAHAVSASLGQGLNSALQDVQVFSEIFEQKGSFVDAFESYSQIRLPDALAVTELSSNANPVGKLLRFELIFRTILNKILPEWTKKYFRRLPRMAIAESKLSYSEILEECQWWVDKVKASVADSEQEAPKSKDE